MMKLPLHRMDATTLRMMAREAECFARQLQAQADQMDRDAARAVARGKALRAWQEGRRTAAVAYRVQITRAILEAAPTAAVAASTGAPLRTVQRVKSEIASALAR